MMVEWQQEERRLALVADHRDRSKRAIVFHSRTRPACATRVLTLDTPCYGTANVLYFCHRPRLYGHDIVVARLL